VKYQAQGEEGLTSNPSLAHAIAKYKLSALRARISEENTINATTQQFITAKISSCTLKQGVKHTHHCVRAIYSCKMRLCWSCRIRAVEHRKCVAGPADAHPGLHNRILQNFTRIENAHEVRKETFNFLLCVEVQQTVSFHFSLLRHYQLPESFHV